MSLFSALCFYVFSTISCTPSVGLTPLPKEVMGTWVVTKVNIDSESSRRLTISYDDPQLMGRIFTFSASKITSNTISDTCDNPMMEIRRMKAGKLFAMAMWTHGIPPRGPIPEDYWMPFGSDKVFDVYTVRCNDGLWNGAMAGDNKTGVGKGWFVLLPGGQILVHWYDSSVITLDRLPADAKPDPSFDCKKATLLVEKTICGSVSLSLFDRSVMQAYRNAFSGFSGSGGSYDPNLAQQVKASQKAWLKKRNACGSNEACIIKLMREQISFLSNPLNFDDLE